MSISSGPINSESRQHIQHTTYGVAAVEGRGRGGVERVTPKQRAEKGEKKNSKKKKNGALAEKGSEKANCLLIRKR